MFNSSIASEFNTNEVCVIASELEEVSNSKSHRSMETFCATWLDKDSNIRQIKQQGVAEMREERAEFLRALSKRHHDYVVDTRKALAYTFSKRALYVLIAEMSEHDKALADKAGREFCNTYNELERAIESVELRLTSPKSTANRIVHTDQAVMARTEIYNRGSVRLEKMDAQKKLKVKYALKVNTAVELVNHGWHIVSA